MSESFLDGKVTLLRGDCLELLPTLAENSIDSCVTDPPYHLTSIVKRFSNATEDDVYKNAELRKTFNQGKSPYARSAKGFMGKQWDGGDIAFRPELWAEVFRVLKPGAHLLAFSGTRTYHRMACAIEDAGFEIRDQIGWCYGSGFPKSHDISKAIDRMAGAEREVVGARKGSSNAGMNGIGEGGFRQAGEEFPVYGDAVTDAAIQWQGWGTALKPAWEPIVLARKPLSESSIAANVLKHGTGGINVDGCRVEHSSDADKAASVAGARRMAGNARKDASRNNEGWQRPWQEGDGFGEYIERSASRMEVSKGRWPANLIHDGSEEVVSGFPESKAGTDNGERGTGGIWSPSMGIPCGPQHGDSGSAARFFYTAKADSDDRLGSKHPTVKPIDLIRYLTRLVTPKGGTILDPFAGTGTAGEASFYEGFQAVLIEREPEYQADIVKRMGLCLAGPDERRANSVTQQGLSDTPLFGGIA